MSAHDVNFSHWLIRTLKAELAFCVVAALASRAGAKQRLYSAFLSITPAAPGCHNLEGL